MKSRNIFLGLLFIILGTLWLLDTLNILDFQWRFLITAFFDLWPLILIGIGINLLMKNKTVEKIIWIIFFIVLLVYSFLLSQNTYINTPPGIHKDQVHFAPLEKETVKGKVDLDIGGVRFAIASGTSNFTDLSGAQSLDYKVNTQDFLQSISISNAENIIHFMEDFPHHSFDLKLNKSIPWDIDIDAGAIDGRLDLKGINLEECNLDIGAGKAEFILGKESPNVNINMDAGLSQVIVHIPKDSGIRIDLEGGLHSTNLSELDLIKKGENTYISKNYQQASSRYNIKVDMGLGDFQVYYYVE